MSSLRRSVDFDAPVGQLSGAASRLLQLSSNATVNETATSTSDKNSIISNNALMLFSTGVAVLVVACCAVCIWNMIKRWLCRQSNDNESPHAMVMSGRVFNLTPKQRRAVLEAIFSETNKAVAEKNEACSKEKCKNHGTDDKLSDRVDGDIPMNVKALTLSTTESSATSEEGSDRDIEAGVVMNREPDVPLFPAEYGGSDGHLAMTAAPTGGPHGLTVYHQDGQFEIETNNNSKGDHHTTSTVQQPPAAAAVSTAETRSVLHIRVREVDDDQEIASPTSRQNLDDLAVPKLTDGSNTSPPPCGRDKSTGDIVRPAATSEFDDDVVDNVCPICLNGHDEGDTLIASKHCSHLFHKGCILEWLEKHDSCPVCRVDMVTEGELNKAATSIVGRTRMCVAVEMRNSPPRSAQNTSRPGTQPRHVLPAHRHIIAAPETPPASPYQASRTIGYAFR